MSTATFDARPQAGDHAANFFGFLEQRAKRWFVDVADIPRAVELRTHFGAGCLGVREEAVKVATSITFKAFSDVRRHGERGAADLVAHREIPRKRPLLRN